MSGTKPEDTIISLGRLVVNDFFHDNSREAYVHLNELVDGLTGYIGDKTTVTDLGTDAIAELNDMLLVLAGAMAARDSVLICDIMEYELLPFFGQQSPAD